MTTPTDTLGGASHLFRALADPTRLRILNLLREGEVCVGDLVDVLEIPQPTTSRHLASLRRSGLVACRQEGPWRHYALAPTRTGLHRGLRRLLDSAVSGLPELRADRERLEARRRDGGCC